uniref:Ribosomal protein S3 n=1 Tax=Pavo cristatus TaxID=9049 RepID=A0A8C9L8N3_PAVCR
FVADGIFKAELNEFLTRELAEDGYSGVEVRVTPTRTEIIILATRTQNVLGEKGRRIRELTAVVQKRFGFPEGSVEVYLESKSKLCCHGTQVERLAPKSLFQIMSALWNPKKRSCPPPPFQSRKVANQNSQPCRSQSPLPER